MTSGGTGATLAEAETARTSAATAMVTRRPAGVRASAGAGHTSITTDAASAVQISMRCASCVPKAGTISRLKMTAPITAPIVLAAYTGPTSRAWSPALGPTAASATGKLAPQKHAAGTTAMKARSRSIWKLNHGPEASAGSIGQ